MLFTKATLWKLLTVYAILNEKIFTSSYTTCDDIGFGSTYTAKNGEYEYKISQEAPSELHSSSIHSSVRICMCTVYDLNPYLCLSHS